MVLKGVKATYSDDKTTVTTWAYPSKAGYDYKLVVMRGGMTKTISEEYPLVEYSE